MQAERKSNNISPSNGPVCSSTKWAFMKPDWRFDRSQVPGSQPSGAVSNNQNPAGPPYFHHPGVGSAVAGPGGARGRPECCSRSRSRSRSRAGPRRPRPPLTCTRASVRSSLMASSSLGRHTRRRQPSALLRALPASRTRPQEQRGSPSLGLPPSGLPPVPSRAGTAALRLPRHGDGDQEPSIRPQAAGLKQEPPRI